jgi:hypothetical protein
MNPDKRNKKSLKGRFEDETITIDSVFGPLKVVVTGEVLHLLWGADTGPQDGKGLIDLHRDLVTQIATMKFENDEGEDDHVVRITEMDMD